LEKIFKDLAKREPNYSLLWEEWNPIEKILKKLGLGSCDRASLTQRIKDQQMAQVQKFILN